MSKFQSSFKELIILKEHADNLTSLVESTGLQISAKLSYILYWNKIAVYNCYRDFIKSRKDLAAPYVNLNEDGSFLFLPKDDTQPLSNDNSQLSWKENGEKEYEEELQKLLETETNEIQLRYENDINRNIDKMFGEHLVLESLWTLLDLYKSHGK
jgi:hypothetical protein